MKSGDLKCSYGRFEDGDPEVYPLFLCLTVQEAEQGGAGGRHLQAGAGGAEGDQLLADGGVPAHLGEAGVARAEASQGGRQEEEVEEGDHPDITGQTVTPA